MLCTHTRPSSLALSLYDLRPASGCLEDRIHLYLNTSESLSDRDFLLRGEFQYLVCFAFPKQGLDRGSPS
jgi:hypothetical protein